MGQFKEIQTVLDSQGLYRHDVMVSCDHDAFHEMAKADPEYISDILNAIYGG